MTRGPSNRALFEAGLICGLIVAVVTCGLIATRPHPTPTPQITNQKALDLMRALVDSHLDTLRQFRVISNKDGLVRARIEVPEEFPGVRTFDVTYTFGWYVDRILPVSPAEQDSTAGARIGA